MEKNIPKEGEGSTEITPQAHQINKVAMFPRSNTRKEVQRFMECINVLRNWTDKVSPNSHTLRKLMTGNMKFQWSSEAQVDFDAFKEIAGYLSFLSPYDDTV